MNTNIQKYLAFIKTVEYGSFTKAAQILSYSQSGISRMINDLETEWNVILLERGRSGLKLTSDGKKILPLAESLCKEYAVLQEQVNEINGLQAHRIRIGTFSSVATHWLPGILKEFQKDHPDIDYELLLGDYTDIEEWIAESRVDCGFLPTPTLPDFETVALEQDKLLVILAEDHPLAGCEKFPIKALCDYPFMLLEKGAQAEIAAIFERHGLTPKVHFSTWDDYTIMAMVEGGLGISIVPQLMLKRTPYRIVAKELEVPAYRKICLAMRSLKRAPIAVRLFMDYLDRR